MQIFQRKIFSLFKTFIFSNFQNFFTWCKLIYPFFRKNHFGKHFVWSRQKFVFHFLKIILTYLVNCRIFIFVKHMMKSFFHNQQKVVPILFFLIKFSQNYSIIVLFLVFVPPIQKCRIIKV